MRVHPMLEREPLCAEERARQAARPEVLPLKFGHLRGEPLGRDEPLDLRGNQIPRAPRHRRDVVTPHPRVYELDGLKLLDLEDATVEIAVRIGLTTASRRLRSATRK